MSSNAHFRFSCRIFIKFDSKIKVKSFHAFQNFSYDCQIEFPISKSPINFRENLTMNRNLPLFAFILLSISLNAQIIPTKDLYFHAPCNANLNDTVSNLKATIYGATPATDRFNQDSGAFYFDGDNDWADFGTKIQLDDIKDFTFCAWIQPGALDYPQNPSNPTKKYTIIGDASSGGGFRFSHYQTTMYFQIQQDKDWDVAYNRNTRNKNSWVHLVGVSNNGYVLLYENGVLKDSVDKRSNSLALGSDNFEVARGTAENNTYWEGAIDDIRIYNRALRPKEVQNLYMAEKINGTVCRETITINDTIFTQVYDTNYTNVTIYDTVYATLYDTIPYWDTLLSNDTLAISIATNLNPNPIRSLFVYPNPVTTNNAEIVIEIDNISQMQKHTLTITNSSGQEVWKATATSSKFNIKTSTLGGAGLYHLNIRDQKGYLIGRSTISLIK